MNIWADIKNGRAKDYDYFNNEIIFEGEYLNGEKWNGKAKDYDNHHEIIFEGVYLNGKRWNGKGH